MHPYLFQIPGLGVWVISYYVMIALAVAVSFFIGPRWVAALEHLPAAKTRRIMLVLGSLTFLGGHLHYLLNSWRYAMWKLWVAGQLDAFLPWSGFHAGGAIVTLVLTAPFVLRHYGVPIGKFGDALTPTVGIGIAIARLGCFLQGCCYGRPCTWPWCIPFPYDSNARNYHVFLRIIPPDAPTSAPVHPLQLYFAAVGIVITLGAIWLQPRKRYDGQVALVALLVFSTTSWALEYLREDFAMRAFWGPLPQLTWTAIAMSAASFAALAVGELVSWRRTRVTTVPA